MRQYAKMHEGARRAMGSLRWLVAAILGAAAFAGATQAGEVYKSVDANGTVVYSDHLDPSLSGTTTIQLDDARFPPHELHFCWTNCFTLVLEQGIYHRADGTDETWTVQTFSDHDIVLHRHDAPADWNGRSQDVVYAGQVANDRLVNVTVDGKPTSGVDASWGSALNTLPGSNAERDAPTTGSPNPSASSVVKSDTTPPPLPEEEQPALVQDGYLWTPGYWYWRDLRYVWIPGAWARPPQAGLLWTPAYWVRAGTVYVFHPGRWGATVGYYGGINYGFGYLGNGYSGGHWIGGSFAYNTAVNHVDPAVVHHTYVESVVHAASATHAGGASQAMATHQSAAAHEPTTRTTASPVTAANSSRSRPVTPTPQVTPTPVTVTNSVSATKPMAPSAPPRASRAAPTHAAPIK